MPPFLKGQMNLYRVQYHKALTHDAVTVFVAAENESAAGNYIADKNPGIQLQGVLLERANVQIAAQAVAPTEPTPETFDYLRSEFEAAKGRISGE